MDEGLDIPVAFDLSAGAVILDFIMEPRNE
jgi:hypothetical protein